ncbi:MAG: chain length determinant protein EpsF [Aquabacterium sp.]
MTFDQFFRILKARWLLTLSIVTTLVVLTLGICLLLPKSYKATASVMIDMKPDPVSQSAGMGIGTSQGLMATQIDLIKSPTVAMRVARSVGMEASPEVNKQWAEDTGRKGDYLSWVGELISKNLDVEPARESNIVDITYSAVDPKFAAVMANAFAKAYMESSVQLRTDPARQYLSFFEERANMARQKLEAAQMKLAQAQKERGIVATDERLDAENTRLSELSTHIAALRAAAADARFRSEKAQTNADQMQDIITNPLISSLKADLARQEAKLEEMSSKYGDAYPAVQETKASIASTRDRLASETRRLTRSLGVTNSVSSSREADAVAAYEEQRAKVLKLKETRSELSVMEREVDIAQRVYESILARQSQMGLESSNNQNNVVLVTAATEPAKHSFPKIPLALALAMTVGVVLAIIAVMGVEMWDRRIRGIQDLIQGTGLPVVGVLPNPKGAGWTDRFKLKGRSSGTAGLPLIGTSAPALDVGRSIKA